MKKPKKKKGNKHIERIIKTKDYVYTINSQNIEGWTQTFKKVK